MRIIPASGDLRRAASHILEVVVRPGHDKHVRQRERIWVIAEGEGTVLISNQDI